MRVIYRYLPIVLSLTALVTPARALTALDLPYGTASEGESVRSLAMGSVGVSELQGSSALVQNPALLAGFQGKAWFDLQVAVEQANEDRFIPLYDTFDDLVAETAYVINRNTYATAQGGFVYRLPMEMPSALAVGIFERYNADWNYEEELRDPSTNLGVDQRDRLLQINRVEDEGRLRSLSFGYAAELVSGMNLGVSLHRYFGDLDFSRQEIPVSGTARIDRLVRDLSGWGWTVGTEIRASSHLSLGASIEAPVTLDGQHSAVTADTTTIVAPNGDYELELPTTFSLGVTIRPRNVLRTTVSLEARRRLWEDVDDAYAKETARLVEEAGGTPASPVVRDIWDLRLGVEHVFYNGMPVRFGLRYLENYRDSSSERTIFSAGTGWKAGEVTIELTGQYIRQTSRQDFVFDPSAAGLTAPPPLAPKVEDSVLRLAVGLSRRF